MTEKTDVEKHLLELLNKANKENDKLRDVIDDLVQENSRMKALVSLLFDLMDWKDNKIFDKMYPKEEK